MTKNPWLLTYGIIAVLTGFGGGFMMGWEMATHEKKYVTLTDLFTCTFIGCVATVAGLAWPLFLACYLRNQTDKIVIWRPREERDAAARRAIERKLRASN